jgi:hypothetical protein
MKEIELLEEQIAKLESKEFDFRAWKQYTIILLSRIFGDEDQKVKQINKLEMDYSSWSLRDASGRSSQADTIKKLGKEILLAAVDELKSFGIPAKNLSSESNSELDIIHSALENELKVAQLKELILLSNRDIPGEVKKNEITKKLAEYGDQVVRNILTRILANDKLKIKA